MFRPFTTGRSRRTKKGTGWADWLSRLYPVLLFLAETAVAARGYLFWPSIAPRSEGPGDEFALSERRTR